MSSESTSKTIIVAFLVCLVCSVFVAGSAVALKAIQDKNKLEDKQSSVLAAAGMYDPAKSIAEQFESIETQIVDISTGKAISDDEKSALEAAGYNVERFDAMKAQKDLATKVNGKAISFQLENDPASIKRVSRYQVVYLVKENDAVKTVILPVSGYGLWSTLYGFLALEGDLNTIVGLGFYSHAETPGLGGEVDNPRWKAQWQGKMAFNDAGEPVLKLKKGIVDPAISAEKNHQVDGLAGATLTSNGVTNLLQFWLGEDAFGPYLQSLAGGAN